MIRSVPSRPIFGPAGLCDSFQNAKLGRTEQVFPWLAGQGLGAFEYSAGRGVSAATDTYVKIGASAAEHGIALSFHAPYYISLSSTDQAIRDKSLVHISKSLAAAQAMGADIIVIHPGGTAAGRSEALRLAKDTLVVAIEQLGELYPDIRWGVETMGKQGNLGTLDEVIDICSLDKRLVPVVDWGHMWARERGMILLTEGDFEQVFDTVARGVGADVAQNLHCHFSKIEFTAAGEKRHMQFADEGYGPDHEMLLNVIAKRGLTPRIICESAGSQATDALAMQNYYLSKVDCI